MGSSGGVQVLTIDHQFKPNHLFLAKDIWLNRRFAHKTTNMSGMEVTFRKCLESRNVMGVKNHLGHHDPNIVQVSKNSWMDVDGATTCK